MLARANAIVNQVYVLSLNTAGPVGWGQSVCVDPEGAVLEQSGREPSTIVIRLDLDEVTRVRTQGTAGLNRLWAQLRDDDDEPIALPAYGGAMTPGLWDPARLDD